MQPDPLTYVGFTEKGSVVLLPEFRTSDLGRGPLLEQAVYLLLAQKANHAPATMTVEGVTVHVQCGEWFGSRGKLAKECRLDRKTLDRRLENLEAIGAITLQKVEKQRRTDRGISPTPSRKVSYRGQIIGTIAKVHGWIDFRARVSNSGHGPKFPHQVKSVERAALVRAPRLSAAQRAINEQALSVLKAGAL